MRWPWSRRQRTNFDSQPINITEMFAQMEAATGTTASRSEALSVPAVRRGRNLICSVATMPLEQRAPDNEVADSALLRQIDPDVPNVVTIAQTVEDLLFDGISWWMITAKDFNGFPVSARHLEVTMVSLQPPNPPTGQNPAPLPSGVDPRDGVVWVDGQPVAANRIIRFDSPNPAFLKHAGREIRRAIALDKTAVMYANDPRPADYFTPNVDADEISDDEVIEELAKWKWARKNRATAYIPRSLLYNSVDTPAPRDLQLVELQRQVSLDIANALGIDPEDLGISTTSRTYANDVDRRRNKLNEVLAPYMRGVTDRLSMGDVTRRGYTVRFNTTDYLLPNPTERWNTYETALGMGATTIPEIRDAEGMPPLPAPPPPPPAPPSSAVQPAEEAEPVTASRPATVTMNVNGSVHSDRDLVEIIHRETIDLAEDQKNLLNMTFDHSRGLTFVDVPVSTFSVNREGRVIEGLVLPYDQYASKGGLQFRFDRGALRWDAENPSRVKLLRDHDPLKPIGVGIQFRDTDGGVLARFKVARGQAGDEAIQLAEDKVLDGFSVGVDFDAGSDTVPDPDVKGALLVRRADWRETSLTAMPSFDNARVTSVAASRTTGGGPVPDTPVIEPSPAPDPTDDKPTALALSDDQMAVLTRAFLQQPTAVQALLGQPAAPETPAAPSGITLSQEQIDTLLKSQPDVLGRLLGFNIAKPEPEPERPEVVDPTRRSTVSFIHEALPYRFDTRTSSTRNGPVFVRSEFDFSRDLHEMALVNDVRGDKTDAGKRVMGFLEVAFADTDTADVNELNEAIRRPDLYVDQRDFRYPIWDSINRGAPPNGVQPFMFPKFSSASGLIGDHTEGTEPTGGTFVTTSQTITPTALSGKASITREVWDMGGNPAVSTLIFNQMLRGWREGLESAAGTFLNTLTAATDIALGVAVVDEALVAAWDTAVAGLQFVRGYDFSMFAVEAVLYGAFVNASDNDGRKLIPQINPQNASGSARRRFISLDLAGVEGVPAWGLASTPAAVNNSWLYDPAVVWGFASAPQRLEFPGSGGVAAGANYQPVSHVDLAIWGYKAFANTDIAGVRQVTYDSTAP